MTTLSDSEFQTVGAATAKARLAKTVRVRGTANLGAWLDRVINIDAIVVVVVNIIITQNIIIFSPR